MEELLYGFTIEYWKDLYFDKKLPYRDMSYLLNISTATICNTIKELGWHRKIKRRVCVKTDKNESGKKGITPELISELASSLNMQEKEVSDALYGLTETPRNIDVIIHEYGKRSIAELNKIRKCADCEHCDVDARYCRSDRFIHEYNCRKIIEAWLQEPTRFTPGFITKLKDVKGVIYE